MIIIKKTYIPLFILLTLITFSIDGQIILREGNLKVGGQKFFFQKDEETFLSIFLDNSHVNDVLKTYNSRTNKSSQSILRQHTIIETEYFYVDNYNKKAIVIMSPDNDSKSRCLSTLDLESKNFGSKIPISDFSTPLWQGVQLKGLELSPNEDRIVLTSGNGKLLLIDYPLNNNVRRLPYYSHSKAKITKDNRIFCFDKTTQDIFSLDSKTGGIIEKIKIPKQLNAPIYCYSQEKNFAIFNSSQNKIDIYNMQNWEKINTITPLKQVKGSFVLKEFSNDGRILVYNYTDFENKLVLEICDLNNNRKVILYYGNYGELYYTSDYGTSRDFNIHLSQTGKYLLIVKPNGKNDASFTFFDTSIIVDLSKFNNQILNLSTENIEHLSIYYNRMNEKIDKELEIRMVAILENNSKEYEKAKKAFPNSIKLRDLEMSNNNIKAEIAKLKFKEEQIKYNQLIQAITQKNYPLVRQYLNSNYSTNSLSFREYFFIAENSHSTSDGEILFSKLSKYDWSQDKDLLKLYPNYTIKLESKRYNDLKNMSDGNDWCYSCCESYLNRYTTNSTKRKQVEEWLRLAHEYEIAEANRKTEEQREINEQANKVSLDKNTSNGSRADKSELINECYFEVNNNLEFSDSDSDGSLKVYKPSWKVEYNLGKKGIRFNCSHFNIEYGNKSVLGSGGDNWYFYGCSMSSIKVESQSSAIRKGCEVAYDTGNLIPK